MKRKKEFPRKATEEDIANTENCNLCGSLLCPCYDEIYGTKFKLIEGNCNGNCVFRYCAEHNEGQI